MRHHTTFAITPATFSFAFLSASSPSRSRTMMCRLRPWSRTCGGGRRRTRKGLEWPRVRLGTDFPGLDELHAAADRDGVPCLTPEERDQELLHLLYVAATRAMHQLEPNDAVRSCLAARVEQVAPQREDAAMP